MNRCALPFSEEVEIAYSEQSNFAFLATALNGNILNINPWGRIKFLKCE
jgi:hypothetical protein